MVIHLADFKLIIFADIQLSPYSIPYPVIALDGLFNIKV